MLEVFKNELTFKEEVQRAWQYRDFLDEEEDEENILKETQTILSTHYTLDSFLIEEFSSSLMYTLENNTIVLQEEQHKKEYSNKSTLQENYCVYWNTFNGDNDEIIRFYLQLLVRRMKILNEQKSMIHFTFRDSLTELFNRRFLEEFSTVAEQQVKRESSTYAILMVDIDHFKKVNDTYGHQTGDEVIKSLSTIIRERVRQSDVATRYGGEEFLILLHNTDAKGAKIVAESMSYQFKQTLFSFEGTSFNCTLSCGIDILNSNSVSIKKTIENADAALYYCKGNGRDMVSVYSCT